MSQDAKADKNITEKWNKWVDAIDRLNKPGLPYVYAIYSDDKNYDLYICVPQESNYDKVIEYLNNKFKDEKDKPRLKCVLQKNYKYSFD